MSIYWIYCLNSIVCGYQKISVNFHKKILAWNGILIFKLFHFKYSQWNSKSLQQKNCLIKYMFQVLDDSQSATVALVALVFQVTIYKKNFKNFSKIFLEVYFYIPLCFGLFPPKIGYPGVFKFQDQTHGYKPN